MDSLKEPMLLAFTEYDSRNGFGTEDSWFYGGSAICQGYDEETVEAERIRTYKLLALALENKLASHEDVIKRMLQIYWNKSTELSEEYKMDKEITECIGKIEILASKSIEEAIPIFDGFVANVEHGILHDQHIPSSEHKIGILYRFAKIKIALLRQLCGSRKDKSHFIKCFRCKEDNYPNILLICGHAFCKNCLALACIKQKVEIPEGQFLVKCPANTCKHILSTVEIRQAIGGFAYFYQDLEKDVACCAICSRNSNLLKMSCKRGKALYTCSECAEYFLKDESMIHSANCECYCNECFKIARGPIEIKINNGCEICCNEVKDLIPINCEHRVCKGCLMKYINEQKLRKRIGTKGLVCPILNCKALLTSANIKNAIDEATLKFFEDKQYCLDYWVYKCPCKKGRVEFDRNEPILSARKCESCEKSLCIVCKQVAHSGKCKSRMEELKDPSKKLLPCPYCLALTDVTSEKRKKGFVQCEQCETSFCAFCCADALPIMWHGGQYHRPRCEKYDKGAEEEDPKSPCKNPECAGERCYKPLDLVEGDIPPTECRIQFMA